MKGAEIWDLVHWFLSMVHEETSQTSWSSFVDDELKASIKNDTNKKYTIIPFKNGIRRNLDSIAWLLSELQILTADENSLGQNFSLSLNSS